MRSNKDCSNVCRTVRELGGEIWSELVNRISEEEIDWQAKNKVVDIVIGVLARHSGKVIENDKDLPVDPLSEKEKSP